MCAGVKFRRTDKIADILKNYQINITIVKLINSLSCHINIKMTHSTSMKLYCFSTCLSNCYCINI